jgi:isopentenyl diphosphate isomerase/L-lactate dehydrogenase-like FMN-dependent dehydrogenase
MTDLPIVLKGLQTVEDVRAAIKHNVPAVILSNHGGRQLDSSPSSLEVALEIHEEDPDLFNQIEIYADGGIRYGADVLKLLALGVKAVGLGRPFMFANTYGVDGVKHAIQLLKHEIAIDAGNLGLPDLKKINPSYVRLYFVLAVLANSCR